MKNTPGAPGCLNRGMTFGGLIRGLLVIGRIAAAMGYSKRKGGRREIVGTALLEGKRTTIRPGMMVGIFFCVDNSTVRKQVELVQLTWNFNCIQLSAKLDE